MEWASSKAVVRYQYNSFIRILNQLRVFVTRSRHKCSIGLNRLRVIWSFNTQTNSVSSVSRAQIGVIISCSREDWLAYWVRPVANSGLFFTG
jgi:hypothetical protein